MKMSRSIVILAVFLGAISLRAQASNPIVYSCNSGNGSIQLTVSQQASPQEIGVIAINASGVEDGAGQLKCSGPEESAFLCSGKLSIPTQGTGESESFSMELVVPETIFQGYGGVINRNGADYYCSRVAKF